MSERTLTAEEADLMIGRTWFSDRPEPVVVHDQVVKLAELDGEARANGSGPERALFVHGLEVAGTLRVGSGIYVVLGELKAGRIELGNGVLAVAGRVVADDYVHAPRTESGMFAVGSDATSDDATIPALPPVQAPIVVWFDPRRRADLVFTMGPKGLQKVATDALPAALKPLYDGASESFRDPDAVRRVLQSGAWK